VSEGPTPEAIQSIAARVNELTKANERLFHELITAERRFRSVSRSVWRVQEEERRRLARELHDGIGQTLTALKNQLEVTRRQNGRSAEATEGRIDEALTMAAQALEDTRELSRLLRPAVLDDLGLAPAISWLARTVRERFSLEVALNVTGLDDRMDSEIETLAFRIVQEALTNVAKHSGAASARVEVNRTALHLYLRIADEGRGFDPRLDLDAGHQDGGVGLRGMRDRAELFGGTLSIDSTPGRGTRIEVRVPLSGSESEPSR
jgi:two-component system sensor histidine kinase UhpB